MRSSIVPSSQQRLAVLLFLVVFSFSRVTAALLLPIVHARTTLSALTGAGGASPGRTATWEVLTTATITTSAITSLSLSHTRGTHSTTLTTVPHSTDVSQAPNTIILLLAQPPILDARSDPIPTVTGIPGTSTDTADSAITPFALPSGVSDISGVQEKWYLTTYWSCITDAVQTHCGWHEPVLPGGDDSVAGAATWRGSAWSLLWVMGGFWGVWGLVFGG